MTDTQTVTTVSPPPVTIVPATDLGNVEVAKAGNLYLLTDARGDIRPDGRGLGLYLLDTRVLSASMFLVNGAQLTLLRGPHRDGDMDTIQLTNPELRHNPADKHGARPTRSRCAIFSVTRARRIEGSLFERVVIESFSADDRAAPRSSSVSAWTWPTSSRSAAIRGRLAARSCRSTSTATGSRSATTGSMTGG